MSLSLARRQSHALDMVGGRYRVLVIDDEADLRALICLLLEFDGDLEVVSAGGADEALAAASAAADTIDLVVLDHWLGGDTTGLDIADRLHSSCPRARFVLFTAGDAETVPNEMIDAIVAKPQFETLPAVARRLLTA